MAKVTYPAAIIADGTYLLGHVDKARNLDSWKGLFFAYGTFGSGTVAWNWSPVNSSSTLLAMKDYNGTAMTSTANDSFTSEFVTGSHNDDKIALYAVVTGSSGASITIGFYNNVG